MYQDVTARPQPFLCSNVAISGDIFYNHQQETTTAIGVQCKLHPGKNRE
jgi:hypothetical protein